MAPAKRKRNSTRAYANKKPKYTEDDSQEASGSGDIYWEAEDILAERRRLGKKEYLIQWKGKDPTGTNWDPTWEPEDNANTVLIASWERRKASKSNSATITTPRARKGNQSTPNQRRQATPRTRRIIESSPERSTVPSPLPSAVSTPRKELEAPAEACSAATSPTGSPDAPHTSPQVQVVHRGSSLDKDEFERFSQLVATQTQSGPAVTQSSNLDSSQLFDISRQQHSGVIPDSQSGPDDESFVESTQRTGQDSGRSTNTDSATAEEEEEDSGLLEIVQNAEVQESSPTRSIPETIPADTSASLSQQPQVSIVEEAPREIPDTFDTTDSLHTVSASEQTPRSPGPESEGPVGQLYIPETQAVEVHGQQTDDAATPLDSAQTLASAEPRLSDNPSTRTVHHSSHHSAERLDFIAESGHSADQHITQPSQVLEAEIPAPVIISSVEESPGPGIPEANTKEDSPASSQHYNIALDSPSQDLYQVPRYFEQNAQAVSIGNGLSTQEDSSESIRTTIEKLHEPHVAQERHDSSQETSSNHSTSRSNSLSAVPVPPAHTIVGLNSIPPPRPETPEKTSSRSIMSANDDANEVARRSASRFEDEIAKMLADEQAKAKENEKEAEEVESPRHPTFKLNRVSGAGRPRSSADANVGSSTGEQLSARQVLRANLSPPMPDGTRSPSAIPARSPAPPVPTSLRTVAITANHEAAVQASRDANVTPSEALSPPKMPAHHEGIVPAASIMEALDNEDDEMDDTVDDDDQDDSSYLNDDMNLALKEYVVPLELDGRQRDSYSKYIAQNRSLLDQFLVDKNDFHNVGKIDEIITRLQALETHIDLVFAEAGELSSIDTQSLTRAQHMARWASENSSKFRFLHTLFHNLRHHNKHIALVIGKNDEVLLNLIEVFIRAKRLSYLFPLNENRRSDPDEVEGNLSIIVFPVDASLDIHAPDLIVCLDGSQNAASIRRQKWALSPQGDLIPILHLIVSRSVTHIERYVSPSLDQRERLYAILVSLTQIRSDVGKPMDVDTPRPGVAAERVVDWLSWESDIDIGESEWPLPPIGPIKDLIDYQTQMSEESSMSPEPERVKRPLDDAELDPAKRMRFTPQPADNENDITHISDSMPGTAGDVASLRKQVARLEEAFSKERAARQAIEQRFKEHEASWDRQQHNHESVVGENRKLRSENVSLTKKVEDNTRLVGNLRERLDTYQSENRELHTKLKEQREIDMLSGDDKKTKITQLNKELDEATRMMNVALKGAKSSDDNMEYVKEQWRAAQDAAAEARERVKELEALNSKLEHQASGEPAKLKALQLDRQHKSQDRTITSLRSENSILREQLARKEEELRTRSNNGRMGVGTRAQSATPQPKIRSRAGSPIGNRVSNLRNG